VRRYNGTDVDHEVEVQVFAATTRRPDGTQPAPSWQGNDEWGPVHEWVGKDARDEWSADQPKFFDAHAYVTDWILVARLERFQTPKVMLSHMVITSRIVPTEFGWSLTEGTMAARANSDDLLEGLANFRDPDTGSWICRDGRNYRRHKQNVCSASDIGFEPSVSPSDRCDATSWGWHFTALPAKLSAPVPFEFVKPILDHCDPGQFPGDDSCANP
jgi:hypothetical protein